MEVRHHRCGGFGRQSVTKVVGSRQPDAKEGKGMAMKKTTGYGMTGFIVRNNKSGAYSTIKSGNSFSSVRMPDGEVVKVVDKDLFDRAVRAAGRRK